jgi:hypothetical protein
MIAKLGALVSMVESMVHSLYRGGVTGPFSSDMTGASQWNEWS